MIFVKGADDRAKHPKMRALIGRAGGELIRRRFRTPPELVASVYAALVDVPSPEIGISQDAAAPT